MIHLIVALPAEARGLAWGLGLQRLTSGDGLRQVFCGRGLRVEVCGPGRHRAATAVESIVVGSGSREPQGWLNVGIAGHRDLTSGTCLLAEEILESATGQSWRPTLPFRSNLPKVTVCTVDRPETEFATSAAYDMEASGFFAAASRFVRPGLVQVCKVVSDNRGDDLTQLTADRVEGLICVACLQLSELVEQMTGALRSRDSYQD